MFCMIGLHKNATNFRIDDGNTSVLLHAKISILSGVFSEPPYCIMIFAADETWVL